MRTNLGKLRLIALLEGVSFLVVLGITMPLKYWFDMPTPNYYIGMGHGLLFILYIILVLIVAQEYKWSFGTVIKAGIASVIPFGTFWAEKAIFSKQ